MIHGPFSKFRAMMDDAMKRYPAVGPAFHAKMSDLAYKLLDDDEEIADWSVIEGLRETCGMVVSVKPDGYGDHEWSYEMEGEV